MAPFSYSAPEQKLLLDHYITFRIRLADLDRLIYLRGALVTDGLPAPIEGPDPDWTKTATLIGDVMYGYLASLFDSRSDSVDLRKLFPKLYPERAPTIQAFFSRYELVIRSITRFRHKAVAHVDNTLATQLEAHARRYDSPIPEQFTFWTEFLKLIDELLEGESELLERFTINVQEHVTAAATRAGMMPSRLMALMEQLGFDAKNWE